MSSSIFREALIDPEAISHNVARIAAVTGVDVIAVVKANGYGHGAELAAQAALEGGAFRLGVADISEAISLRESGIEAPIIAWLHGADADFAEAVERRLELGVSSRSQLLNVAEAAAPSRPAAVHLKLDTGLSRNGAAPEEWAELFEAAADLERRGMVRVTGVFSHLANTSAESTREALDAYLGALDLAASFEVTPEIRHLAASDAAIRAPETRLDAVRAGIAIYGLEPFAGANTAELGLRPAMTLRAAIVKVRRVPRDTGVSYDYTYRTQRDTTLALIPLGYGDGVPRGGSGAGPVVVNDKRYTVAGRVAMDQLVIDVGDDPVREGDIATLFGDPGRGMPSADEWARADGTINYEIVTRVGSRVPRVARE